MYRARLRARVIEGPVCPPQKPSAIKVLHRPRLHLIDLCRGGVVSCRSARRI